MGQHVIWMDECPPDTISFEAIDRLNNIIKRTRPREGMCEIVIYRIERHDLPLADILVEPEDRAKRSTSKMPPRGRWG